MNSMDDALRDIVTEAERYLLPILEKYAGAIALNQDSTAETKQILSAMSSLAHWMGRAQVQRDAPGPVTPPLATESLRWPGNECLCPIYSRLRKHIDAIEAENTGMKAQCLAVSNSFTNADRISENERLRIAFELASTCALCDKSQPVDDMRGQLCHGCAIRVAVNERLRYTWERLARDIGHHDKASIAAALSAACAVMDE